MKLLSLTSSSSTFSRLPRPRTSHIALSEDATCIEGDVKEHVGGNFWRSLECRGRCWTKLLPLPSELRGCKRCHCHRWTKLLPGMDMVRAVAVWKAMKAPSLVTMDDVMAIFFPKDADFRYFKSCAPRFDNLYGLKMQDEASGLKSFEPILQNDGGNDGLGENDVQSRYVSLIECESEAL
ncbi:hypothetical protein O6H91_05G043500 [Diphasiastrum complanatum]|uniref:Uncharacterized protein n=1 Tax=Diphasiastrum complanatum TaxID=34168 RepID=A0ACC2DML4_DIPCM|nr:hypothetical protein O6H91_05G043500 [Diphasiastrum complanatum]